MGITSGDQATSSGNGLINPFSTASVPVENSVENPVENLVEKEAGSDPIENLLPALLQIFLTVGLSKYIFLFHQTIFGGNSSSSKLPLLNIYF